MQFLSWQGFRSFGFAAYVVDISGSSMDFLFGEYGLSLCIKSWTATMPLNTFAHQCFNAL
jgi:hypothetical protein